MHRADDLNANNGLIWIYGIVCSFVVIAIAPAAIADLRPIRLASLEASPTQLAQSSGISYFPITPEEKMASPPLSNGSPLSPGVEIEAPASPVTPEMPPLRPIPEAPSQPTDTTPATVAPGTTQSSPLTPPAAETSQTPPAAPAEMGQAHPETVTVHPEPAPLDLTSPTPPHSQVDAAPAPAPEMTPKAIPPVNAPKEARTEPELTLKKLPDAAEADGSYIKSLGGGAEIVSLDLTDMSTGKPDIAEPIELNEAVAFALKNNFESQASGANVKSAYWDKIGAYSQYAPSVDWKYSVGQEDSSPAAVNDDTGNRIPNSDHVRRDHIFAVRQPLIDLAVIQDIFISKGKEDLAALNRRDSHESIAYDTTNAYLKLVQARIAVKLADQYKGYLDDLSKRMKARVEGGGATGGDLDRINGRATVAESARIEAVGEYEADLAEFRRLTHITPAQLTIPDSLAPAVPDSAQDAIERATTLNPSYLGSLRQIDIAGDSRDKSYAAMMPKLSLEYSDTYSYDAGGAAYGNPVDGVYPTQEDKRTLLVAHWALNGGIEATAALSGAQKVREARYKSQDVHARLEQAIRSTYNAINASNQRMIVLKQGVESNARVVKEFEDQYQNGSRSLFELLDAHEQLYSSRLNLMRLYIAKAQASYLVHRQMGELVSTLVDTEKQRN